MAARADHRCKWCNPPGRQQFPASPNLKCSLWNGLPTCGILGSEVLNPTVRTRKHEVVSRSIAAVSNKPNPLKPALPKKRSACAKKPSCFHPALYARNSSAKPDAPKQPLI